MGCGVTARKVILAVAPNGARLSRSENCLVPIAPDDVAEDVIASASRGAAMVHLHARDSAGRPSQAVADFKAVTKRICVQSDIAIQFSFGSPGFEFEEAMAPLALAPVSGTVPLRLVTEIEARRMADRIARAGAVPQLDISTCELARLAVDMSQDVPGSVTFGIVLPHSEDQPLSLLQDLVRFLPPGAVWWVCKGGKRALEVGRRAVELGGHWRVGLEDAAPGSDLSRIGNSAIVAKAAELIRDLGHSLATPNEARALISSPERALWA